MSLLDSPGGGGFQNSVATLLPGQVTTADIADGAVTSIKLANDLQSDNYVSNVSGWRIQRNTGNAEFNQGLFRGSIVSGNPAVAAVTLDGALGRLSWQVGGTSDDPDNDAYFEQTVTDHGGGIIESDLVLTGFEWTGSGVSFPPVLRMKSSNSWPAIPEEFQILFGPNPILTLTSVDDPDIFWSLVMAGNSLTSVDRLSVGRTINGLYLESVWGQTSATGVNVNTVQTNIAQVTLAIPAHWNTYVVWGSASMNAQDTSGGTGVTCQIDLTAVHQAGNMTGTTIWEFNSNNDRDVDARAAEFYSPVLAVVGTNRTFTLRAIRSGAPTLDANNIVWKVEAKRVS